MSPAVSEWDVAREEGRRGKKRERGWEREMGKGGMREYEGNGKGGEEGGRGRRERWERGREGKRRIERVGKRAGEREIDGRREGKRVSARIGECESRGLVSQMGSYSQSK